MYNNYRNNTDHNITFNTGTHRHRGNRIVGNYNSREMKIPDCLLEMPGDF